VLTAIGAHFARGQSGERGSHRVKGLLRAWSRVDVPVQRLKPLDRRRFIYRRQISAWAASSRSQ
jgi:hypothetical protein